MRALYERIRQHPEIRKRPAVAQFIKFSVVGTSNTTLDFLIYTAMTRLVGAHYLAANLVSFTIATTWSYTMNRLWTFRDRQSRIRTQYPKFIIISAIGLGLTSTLLYVFIDLFNLYDLLAKAFSIGIVLFWNFFMNRRWTFRAQTLAS